MCVHIINSWLYLGKENRYLHAFYHGSTAIHSLPIHKLLNEYVAS